ncbi:MAG: long-chain-fatty-acid--CoA ligase [Thermodesulfobacteriota bacterium]
MKPDLFYAWPLLRYADRTAIVFGERRLTFREMDRRINRVSHALLSLGLRKGHKVAMLLHNGVEAAECILAVPRAGLTYVALNPRHSAQEHAFVLNDSETDAVILDSEFLEPMEAVLPSTPSVRFVIVVGPTAAGRLNYEEMLKDRPETDPGVEVDADDIERIHYTSGTTGRPKGAISTFRLAQNRMMDVLINLDQPILPTDVNLNIGPLTHAAGFMMAIYYIRGAANVILRRFDPEEVLRAIEQERVTSVLFIPTMLYRLLKSPNLRAHDLSSLKRVWYGTAPTIPARLKEAIEVFGPIFRQNYGQSESAQPITFLGPEDHVVDGPPEKLRRLASAGKPALGVELKVLREDGTAISPGEIGEIVIRTNHMFKGYWKMPEATAAAFRDGWLLTQDMGTLDEDGYVYIVDRKHDMIISGGFNIYPREVEDAILRHPGVAEAAVIGVPDDLWGENVKAFVVPKDGISPTEEEIIAVCQEHLASYKKPKSVEFVRELPKTPYGKIQRRELKERYWQGLERRVH